MKNCMLLIFVLCFALFSKAQTDNIVFKDGKSVPGRKTFMENCAAGLKSSSKKGKASASQNNYCSCVINALANIYTLDEFLEKVETLDKILEDKSEPIYKQIASCATENLDENSFKSKPEKKEKSSKKQADDVLQNMYSDEAFEKGFMSSCKEAFINAAGLEKGKIDADKYCKCAFNKMKEKNVALADMGKLQDRNSPLFNEIVTPCLQDAMQTSDIKSTSYAPEDIVGTLQKEEIKLSKLMNVYRLSVKFGSVEKYFVLDSGANDVFIDEGVERELLLEGILKKKDYLEDGKYTMADGKQITCKRVNVSGFQIGGFTINNVTVAITNQKNGFLLLGKSLLDKFKHWSIDNEKATLLLEK